MVYRIEHLGFGYLGSRTRYFKNEKFKSGWIEVINRRESVWGGDYLFWNYVAKRRLAIVADKQLKKVEPFEKKICRIV